MFCFVKKYTILLLVTTAFVAIYPTITLAENNVTSESQDLVWGFERHIWEQAVTNVESLERKEESQRIASLTPEERYNEYYGGYIRKLVSLYQKVDYLKDTVKQYQQDIGLDAYNLRDEISTMEMDISDNLQAESKYYYSKDYLVKSCEHLSKAANNLDLYCMFYLNINDFEQAQGYWDNLCAEMGLFEEDFKKANNYYILTKNGITVADNYNESEAQFCKEVKMYYDKFSQIYQKLDTAYRMVESGENPSAMLREMRNSGEAARYSFSGLRTLKYRDVLMQIQEISTQQTEAFDELDRYVIDKLTDTVSENDKASVMAKMNALKTNLDNLKGNLLKIEKETGQITGNVNERTQQIIQNELNEAHQHGYTSVEEYQYSLAIEKLKKKNMRIIQEAERLTQEKQRIQAEYDAMLNAMKEEWLDMRIDFSKPQAYQKHDKAYYMQKVRDNLSDVFAWNSLVGNVIYQKQAAAYDRMWQLAQTDGANVRLLQELYDQYPNDFITIVLVYNMES